MKDALDLKISGIKCDNTECDFIDNTIKVDEYENWLNKPCPKCGQNLLTQADYDNVKLLFKLTNKFNKMLPKRKDDEKDAHMSMKMDGSGKIDFNIQNDGSDL